MKRFALVLGFILAGCGAAADTESTDTAHDDLTATAWSLSSYDPLPSYASARSAAATLVTAPDAVQLHAERTPGGDNLHTQPQPYKPLYTWTWTFRGTNGVVNVVVGRGKKPKASRAPNDPTIGGAPLNFATLSYHARDLYAELAAGYPDQAHHAFDALDLVGPMAGNPQGWQALVYEQGNDDRLFFIDGARGGAKEMSID